MDFRRLGYFMRIAELGSLSKAADRLRIAQPALSRQVRILEEELGVTLFARHRRGMYLTREGEELRNRIVGPLRQIDHAVEDIRAQSREAETHVALGLPPSVSYILAGPLTKRVLLQAPTMSLRVVEGYAGHLIDWLQRGEIDIALLYGPASGYQLAAEELLLEELMLVGPPDSPLSPSTPVPFASLANLPLALPSHPHGLRVVVDQLAARTGTSLSVRFQADSFTLLKNIVEAGLGHTILPLSAFSRDVQAGRVRYAPITNPRVTRQLVLGMARDATRSRAAQKLGFMVREEVASLVKRGEWIASLMFVRNQAQG